MWKYNSEYNKWSLSSDVLGEDDFNLYLQELSLVRFYSKALSGATYLPVNSLDNIYEVIGTYKPRNWYISIDGSQYTNTLIPSFNAEPINGTTSTNYYQKFLSEYGLSLKTLFTPKRLIDDGVKNYLEVDLATTTELTNIGQKIKDFSIDGFLVKEGHRILVKDQKSRIVLANTIDADEFFLGSYTIIRNLGSTIEYEYFNEENGIYQVQNSILVKTNELQTYENCVRYSVVVKMGETNRQRQFHLKRLTNGYFPIDIGNEQIEFVEKRNWMLRNKINYNNLFEINHYDIIKHGTQSYPLSGITYSIPERIITVGEFGTIICHQSGISNLISNKYKVNLRSISQTSKYYWVCGDSGVLLKIRKHDFQIEKINLELDNKYSISLRSISFFSDLRGVVVGDLNTIYLTTDSGTTWKRLRIKEFDAFYFTKVIFTKFNNFIIVGKSGVFVEFKETVSGWTAYRRRISKLIDDDDDYLLVDNINDMFYTNINTWNLNFQYFTQSIPSDKELIFMTTDDSKLIVYDINKVNGLFDFLYLELDDNYSDIINIYRREGTNDFYFTGMKSSTSESGIFSFDISNFQSIGVGNSYSNTISYTSSTPQFESEFFPNEIFDYSGTELLLCGNESLLKIGTYSSGLDFTVPDSSFENRLKSKLLFLDYDAASKLNFFTDFGEYRLPNQLQFRGVSFSTGSSMFFEPIVYSPTFPDYLTQSETNWWTYKTDEEKTFEFYNNSNPLDESSMVLMSSSFSYSPTQSEYIITKITNTASVVSALAPTITETNHSRFNAMGLTAISDPLVSDELYLYKYLMIFKTTDFGYPVSVGDVMRLSSSYVEGNFVVNKIANLSSGKYIYMFSEFNDNLITNLKGFTASIKNLNVYSSVDELEQRFNQHPISKAYKIESSYLEEITSVSLYPLIGQTYTNWSVQGLTESTNFSVSGFTTSSINSLLISPSSGSGAQTASIFSPEVDGVTNVSFSYDYQFGNYLTPGSYSIISIQGLSSSTWIEIATYSIPETLVSIPQNVDIQLTSTFSQFRFDFTVVERSPGGSGYMWISIQDINLSSQASIETDLNSYGVTYSNNRFLDIVPQFNNVTSYYNLATNIFMTGDKYTMSYTEGFLDFKYTPTYNILSYLEGLNDVGYPNPKFTADKEYYAMPDYRAIPMEGSGIGIATNSVIYLDSNGITYSNYFNPIQKTSNVLKFGSDLELEWQSIFINTFVDIHLWNSTTYIPGMPSSTTERLLVLNKYYDDIDDVYVIEFHKNINYNLGDYHYFIDIVSRRTLKQISDDLQELNNIQKGKFQRREIVYPPGNEFYNYERELNFKIPTDSYAKILLSDADTFQSLTAIMYIDYKNEMSMNILNLEEQVTIPILNTANFAGNLFIFCTEKHGLKTNDSVVLEFNGGTFSSEKLNQNYFGYHPVIVVNEYNFYLDFPYGNVPLTGGDTGYVKYSKQDPFLEFSPVDLIDVGIDKRGKQSIELSVENQLLSSKIYSLVNVDFNKFRYRLIGGLDLNILYERYSWILEAEISDAIIGLSDPQASRLVNSIVWYKGIWESGRWFGGRWISGQWISGDWYQGIWDSREIEDKITEVSVDKIYSPTASVWYNGRWFDGTWNQGLWVDGRWYGGTWNNGVWYRGIWNDGTWNTGVFGGGIWVLGTWNDGRFNCDNEPSFWLDGKWFGGDFENGIWYNGTWNESNGKTSRFGINSYNSRTSIWHSGSWLNGEFHSRLNINDRGEPDVSDVHKYSIWYTGNWFDGDFYGGVAYNMNWRSGTWYGGILEDVQVIGYGNDGPGAYYLILNGIFKFNTGDEFTIIDNNDGVAVSTTFGSNSSPKTYKVLYREEDTINKWTKVYVAKSFSLIQAPPVDLRLRIVSKFSNCNWKSGIWTNGIYERGLWEGGIWYNGIFKATWM